jgi:hypothetical protein
MEEEKESPLPFVIMPITLAMGVIVLLSFLGRSGNFWRKLMDAVERLKERVSDTGDVNPVYGGFEIGVAKPTLFPWHKVIDELLGIGQEIWIAQKQGRICIVSQPEGR